ncbi:MAG: nucleotide sugar dehydrogenase [Solirubrobacteraceae bacterium]|nr:nucleotide sugar dehydrogenase [Solirubrobacteraceae bacterium]
MTVGIMGLGYVGLPLAVAFAEAGEQVIGVDVSARRVAQLEAGESYVEDVPSEALARVAGRLCPTTRPARLALADAIVVCVPTPLTPNREPDLGPLMDCATTLAGVLQPGQLVVLESTTYPGTTRERMKPVLEEAGLVAGRDFHLAFAPERVDPGRTDHTLRTTPRIIGGLTEACGDAAEALYGRICDSVVRVSTPEVAEMAKLLENIFRSVNIALVNELAVLADRMGIDIHEVVDAAATKPYGFMRFDPGPGMGGHCLPVDPFYLSWKAREHDFVTEFIELAGKVNQQAPYHGVERIQRALNDLGRSVRGATVALLGMAYKPGVSDIRESPALKIAPRLRELGAEVAYHDPFVPTIPSLGLESEPLDELLTRCDIAVVVTAQPGIDHAAVADVRPRVDLRGVVRTTRAIVRPPRKALAGVPTSSGEAA